MTDTVLQSRSVDAIVSPSLDYSPKRLEHGQLTMTKLLPLANTQAVTLQATSTTESLFEIPAQVISLAESRLQFDLDLDAPAANISNFVHALGHVAIDRISLYTRSNVYLCDVNNYNIYSRMALPRAIPIEDYLKRDVGVAGPVIFGVDGTAVTEMATGLQKCNSAAANRPQYADKSADAGTALGTGTFVTAPTTAAVDSDAHLVTFLNSSFSAYNNLVQQDGNYRPAVVNTFGTVSEAEPRYLISNKAARSAAIASSVRFDIKLGDMVGTIFSIPQNLVFPEVLIMRIQWAGLDTIAFKGVSQAAVAIGANSQAYTSVVHPATTVTAAVAVAGGAIKNLNLLLAVETSQSLIQQLTQQMRTGGIRLTTPFVFNTRTTMQNMSTASIMQRLNRGHGKSLLRVLYSAFTSGGTKNTAFDNYNLTSQTSSVPSKLREFYTLLDQQRLQQHNLNVANGDDWTIQKRLLKDNVIQSGDVHRANWVFADSWTGKPLAEDKEYDFVDNGVDLGAERLYNVMITSMANNVTLDHYLAFVVQRDLIITSTMITCQ